MHELLRPAAERQHGVVCSRDLRRAGIGAQEVRTSVARGEWVRLRRGAYATSAALASARADGSAHLLDISAVVLTLGGDSAVVSGHSAAQLWGLPTPRRLQGSVTLSDPHHRRRATGYEITCAPLPDAAVTWHGGFRVTTLARTVVDCARTWPLVDGLVVADAARWEDRLTAPELAAAVAAVDGWRGAAAARRVVDLAREGAQSPHETRTRLQLVAAGVPEPRLQVTLQVDGMTAVVDGWWDDVAIAMECDGRIKYREPWRGRSTEEAHWLEKRRAEVFAAAGVRFWRVADADLSRGWPAALARLEAMRAHPLPGPRRFTVSAARRFRRAG